MPQLPVPITVLALHQRRQLLPLLLLSLLVHRFCGIAPEVVMGYSSNGSIIFNKRNNVINYHNFHCQGLERKSLIQLRSLSLSLCSTSTSSTSSSSSSSWPSTCTIHTNRKKKHNPTTFLFVSSTSNNIHSSSPTNLISKTTTTATTATTAVAATKTSHNNTKQRFTTPAEWHRKRRNEMIQKYGTTITSLERNDSSYSIGMPLLILTCTTLWILAIISKFIPFYIVILLSIFPGSMLSLWQLQILHDVIHGSFYPKKKYKKISSETLPSPTSATATATATATAATVATAATAASTAISTTNVDAENTSKQRQRQQQQEMINNTLFWGSLPSIFGYYLYLKNGHLTHHKNTGQYTSAAVFESNHYNFEDGDILFVSHRMKLIGDYGPQFKIPIITRNNNNRNNDSNINSNNNNNNNILSKLFPEQLQSQQKQQHLKQQQQQQASNDVDDDNNSNMYVLKMSISRFGFYFWKEGHPYRNMIIFILSFLFERFMLSINDIIVAITGTNFFFLNKPKQFHIDCTTYARVAVLLRSLLLIVSGWKSLLFLYLSESLWSLPPHPACTMFVTNHGSGRTSTTTATTITTTTNNNNKNARSGVDGDGTIGTTTSNSMDTTCIPTKSTYAGWLYSLFTLGTNYHCEHHDFPTIPFHKLYRLHQIAPEYYKLNNNNDSSGNQEQPQLPVQHDDLFGIMKQAFSYPEFYACMDAGGIIDSTEGTN